MSIFEIIYTVIAPLVAAVIGGIIITQLIFIPLLNYYFEKKAMRESGHIKKKCQCGNEYTIKTELLSIIKTCPHCMILNAKRNNKDN